MANDNSGGLCCIQGALIFFNVITLLGGVATIAIGVVLLYQSFGSLSVDANLVESSYNASEGYTPGSEFYGISIVLVALGSLVTLLSFLGCCGAFVSSRCLLLCYLASVTMILTLQLVASVFAIVFHQPMKEVLRDELMLRTRTQYHPNSSFATAWDVVQTNFQCCGVNGYTDWFKVNAWPDDDIVPDSCCRNLNRTTDTPSCGRSPNQNLWNKVGCFDQIQLSMMEQLHIVASAILAVVFLQLYGIIASILLFYHAKSLPTTKSPGNSTPYKSYSYERTGML